MFNFFSPQSWAVILIIVPLWLIWLLLYQVKKQGGVRFSLERMPHNPLLSPHESNDWETAAVFNPGAVVDDEGFVHLFYRAMGYDGLSKIGHARSPDGHFFERLFGYPVYQMAVLNTDVIDEKEKIYNPDQYASGGGWSGCEDPRVVRIEDRVYMSYTAFEGWHSMRIGLTSIGIEDLKNGRWNWRHPFHISPKNEVNKNWVLFPEKINGKYAILHALTPQIMVEYVDRLESLKTKPIKSNNNRGGRPDNWDIFVRGAASPPLKTDRGWLLLYHGMDPSVQEVGYKIGAMILDINDPTKIIARSPSPILEPKEWYENDWKPGVVYGSGAVIIGENLHLYYGGGDKYICAAHTNLKELLDWLMEHGRV